MNLKKDNSLGIISLVLFILGLLIIGLGVILAVITSGNSGGWYLVFAIWIAIIPLFGGAILALINLIKYCSKTASNNCNRILVIID